jgi:hypothetical protein
MTTRPDPNTPEAPQEATEGRQSAPEGSSGQRETPKGQNEAQTGAESLDGEQQPRGPVDWARHYANQREAQAELPASTAPAGANHPLVKGRCPACRGASLFLGSGGYVTCSRLDCPNPSAADQLLHGEQATPGRAATEATGGCTSACNGATGIRGLLEHVGIDTTGRDITVAERVVDAAPTHNAGPSVAECAQADDAHWNTKYAGEGQ